MGAGRKTSTYDIDTRAQAYQGFEAQQRKLGPERLGGCIFGCSNETQEECLVDLVFGLPRAHWLYVQHISDGMPVFLFNYNSKRLLGIFKAVSHGQMDIKPEGWTRFTGTPRTSYPAQVQVEVYADCEPLLDREYKPILKDCYIEDPSGAPKFVFELKKTEAQALCRAFDDKTKRTLAGQNRPSSSLSTAPSAKEKAPFRPASPPAIPAWGSMNAARNSEQEAPTPDAFPSLPGSSSAPATSQPATSQKSAHNMGTSASREIESAAWQEVAETPLEDRRKPVEAPVQREASQPREKVPSSRTKQSVRNVTTPAESSKSQQPATSQAQQRPQNRRYNDTANDQARAPSLPPTTESSPPKRPSTTAQTGNGVAAKHQKLEQSNEQSAAQRQQAAPSTQNGPQPNGPSSSSHSLVNDSFQRDMKSMQSALDRFDPGASAQVVAVMKSLKDQLDAATRERILLAKQTEILINENAELQSIASKQLAAMTVLKDEATALRADLAFVGQQVAVNVTSQNQLVDNLDLPEVSSRMPDTSLISKISSQEIGAAMDTDPPGPPLPVNESLLILGGNNSKVWLTNVDQFLPSQSNWSQKSQMPEPRGYGAAASVGQSVYLMGGGTGKKWFNTVLRYDVYDEAWFAMADMEEQRGSLGAAAINGKIYAVGGGKPGYQSETCEILDPELNTWMAGKHMRSKRFAINAATLNNALHVVGGFCEGTYLASGERYDPREGYWHELPELTHRRGGHAVVAVDTELYALGGWNNDQFMSEVEVYDARKNAWREFPPLKTAHAYFSAAHLDGKLYVLGGMVDQQNFNDLVEYYDESARKWKAVYLNATDDPLARKRAFIASCKMP